MKARLGVICTLGALAAVAAADLHALNVSVTRADMERALALARWPRTDADRARFHSRYIIPVSRTPVDHWAVEQVEIVTEFRQIELTAEEHYRLGEAWGRGGLREVEDAIGPFRGKVRIVTRLGVRASRMYIGAAPPVEVGFAGGNRLVPIDVKRSNINANCGGDANGCPLIGALVEATFDAKAIGQTSRTLVVDWERRVLARVTIPFADIE